MCLGEVKSKNISIIAFCKIRIKQTVTIFRSLGAVHDSEYESLINVIIWWRGIRDVDLSIYNFIPIFNYIPIDVDVSS